MTKISYVTGDLLASDEIDIAHGCNTRNVMGAGVAGLIAQKWPLVREVYDRECKAGTFVLGSALPVRPSPSLCIWNLATQSYPGPNASLWAVLLSFGNMFEQMVKWDTDRVAIPRIGCGIGGLEWADVERTISDAQIYVGKDAPEVVVYTLESEIAKYAVQHDHETAGSV